jgi:hypothetical protein
MFTLSVIFNPNTSCPTWASVSKSSKNLPKNIRRVDRGREGRDLEGGEEREVKRE